MKTILKNLGLALIVSGSAASLCSVHAADAADPVAGQWDASLLNNGPTVAFRLDISGSGQNLKGTFYDGFKPYDSTTSASYQDGKLILKAEHYLTTITATLKDGELTGNTVLLLGTGYPIKYDFHAVRHTESVAAARNVPTISGSWEIPLETPSSKGEKAFRFIVQQKGADVAASILRVDGDTGAYSGRFDNGKWNLSHFDGSRPGVIEVTATQQGTLEIVVHNEALKRGLEGNDSEKKENSASSPEYAEQRYAGTAKLIAYRSGRGEGQGVSGTRQLRNSHQDPRRTREIHFQLSGCKQQVGVE